MFEWLCRGRVTSDADAGLHPVTRNIRERARLFDVMRRCSTDFRAADQQPAQQFIVGPFGEHETAEEIAGREAKRAEFLEIWRQHARILARERREEVPVPDARELAAKLREMVAAMHGLSDESRGTLRAAADLLEEQADNLENL